MFFSIHKIIIQQIVAFLNYLTLFTIIRQASTSFSTDQAALAGEVDGSK